jgi:arylsulfatase A-like enzyme
LLIVIDTLRADYLGCYGGDAETPNIDALAAAGVTFTNAHSHIPITGPSHSSIFTSKLPSQHGVLNNTQVLQAEQNTLAEIMQALGHQTAAFVSLGVLAGNGFRQGFDVYEDHFHGVWWKTATQVNAEIKPWLSTVEDRSFFLWAHYSDPHEPYASPDGVFPAATVAINGEPAGTFSVNGTRIRVPLTLLPGANEIRITVPGGATFREVRTTEPDIEIEYSDEWDVLMWQGSVYQATIDDAASVTLSNPQSEHRDLTFEFFAHEPVTAELAKRRYKEEVEFVDRGIGELLDEMERHRLLDDTLVVLTADHGESLGEHDHIGHISQLYEPLVRVPLILSHPTKLPRGMRIEEPVAHIDILPTVLDALGLPESIPTEGISLLPLIDGEPPVPARPVLMETHRTESPSDLRAILTGGLKLIRNETQSTVEAYDLTADPAELTNLAEEQHSIVESLRESLDSEFAEVLSRGRSNTKKRAISQEELEKLRSLGYVH